MPQNTDRDWEYFGATDPYFSVVTQDRFHADKLTAESLEDFWTTGVEYIDDVLAKVQRHVSPDFSPTHSLDFGCGVGRLLLPLAEVSAEATGVDVSASMLAEARKEAALRSKTNITFIETGDCDDLPADTYDFIHSFIVFQHMPVERGLSNFAALLRILRPGGVAVLHFTFKDSQVSTLRRWKRRLPAARQRHNLRKGARLSQPAMQMNQYDLNQLFGELHRNGISRIYTEATYHGTPGISLFFAKPA